MCKQYTAPRTCHTRKHFLACGSRTQDCIVVSFLKRVILAVAFHVARFMLMAWPHTFSSAAQHSVSTLLSKEENSLPSATWSSVWPFCRTEPAHISRTIVLVIFYLLIFFFLGRDTEFRTTLLHWRWFYSPRFEQELHSFTDPCRDDEYDSTTNKRDDRERERDLDAHAEILMFLPNT